MKLLTLLILMATIAVALITALRPPVASAQLEPTPILGDPAVITPLVTPAPAQSAPEDETWPTSGTIAATATVAPAANEPDACEPNDAPAQACALPLDAVSGPFTIVPETDQDFFRLELPQEASIQTVITVRSTQGLDLALSARQGDTLVASGAYSLTLAPEVAGPVVLRVENRDPRPASGEQYRVEVRREIVPPDQAASATQDAPIPDELENNWSFENASPIAVGVVYDLSFACPETRAGACPGGDHDYLLVPVKAGVSYLVATFDLDPGVDTVIELFWGTTAAAIAANDDYAPGGALSALHWVAPSDGLLAVRVAPRNGGLPQQLVEAKAGYRFAVAPDAGELAHKLLATIRQQSNVPTPTPTTAATSSAVAPPSTGSGGVAAGSASAAGGAAAQESIPAGPALIVQETVLRREPRDGATALATLAPETSVTVRGPVSGLWVSVESEASILPGWVRWSDLRRVAGDAPGAASSSAPATSTPTPQQSGAADQPAPFPTTGTVGTAAPEQLAERQVLVSALDPALPEPPAPPAARVPFTLSVVVAATDRPPSGRSALGIATPTPDLQQPVVGVRVQLINVFGDLLAESLSDAQGTAQLRRDVRPGDALAVRIPAWGVELPLATDQTRLILTIPEAKR